MLIVDNGRRYSDHRIFFVNTPLTKLQLEDLIEFWIKQEGNCKCGQCYFESLKGAFVIADIRVNNWYKGKQISIHEMLDTSDVCEESFYLLDAKLKELEKDN